MLTTTDTHLYSPAGDSRERPVPCAVCQKMTGNICALCADHCTHTPILEDIDTVLADNAAQAMTRNVHTVMGEVVASIPDGADPETARDLRATAGMARLLADVAAGNPRSHSGWQMLASTLAAVQAKSRALITGVLAVLMLAVGLTVAPMGTPHAAAATTPSSTTTTTTTTVVTTKTTTTTTTTTTVPVVRRRSVVTGYVSAAGYSGRPGYGTINVMIQTRHVVGKGYAPSSYSPVLIQRLVAGQWKTVLTVTTGRDGLVFKQILAPSGVQRYRFLRPQGSTVTAAVSPVYVVAVTDRPGC